MSISYVLEDCPLPQIIRERLPGSLFARHVHYFTLIGSTNAYARGLAQQGGPEGSLVIAERQSRGQGRMGRRWYSPSHKNLLFSIIFRPPFLIERVFSLTMLTALSLVEAIYRMTGLKALIKWPNDVYFRDKKLAGILTEFSAREQMVEYAIVGAGLNVNWDMRGKSGLSRSATSLAKEVGHPVSRVDLLIEILELLERYYGLLLKGHDSFIYRRWNEVSMVIGREVLIDPEGEKKKAKATGIGRNGALLIEEEGGRASSIVCGDVQVLFPSLTGDQD